MSDSFYIHVYVSNSCLGTETSGTASPDMDPSVEIQQRTMAMDRYKGLLQLVGTYWILAVVGAFLLVFLSGEPGFLKTVYLIFFFYLILTYQVGLCLQVFVFSCDWFLKMGTHSNSFLVHIMSD